MGRLGCPVLIFLSVLAVSPASTCLGHGVAAQVTDRMAVVVTVTHEDGSPLAGEAFEVRDPDAEVPLLTGRTDRQGRVVFLADEQGTWQVRVWTEDGHGVTAPVEVGLDRVAGSRSVGSARVGVSGVAAGIGYVLGVFGVLTLVMRRRR